MPRGHSNCSNLLILQGLWRAEPSPSVANGESRLWMDLARSQTGLNPHLVSVVCTLGLIRGFLPRPH